MPKAPLGLYMGSSLPIGRPSDKIVTLDIRPIRDSTPANQAPAERQLPRADTGGDSSRARRVYPEGCIRIHPSKARWSPPRARRSDPALQRRQQGILFARGHGPARAVGAYRRADGRSSAAALMSQSEENARAPLRPDGASDQDRIAQAVEREIERIREARPHLSSRLDRASNLLLLQLASPSRQRPVKVRIAADGRRRFLVRSTSSGDVVYSVDPANYACSCPDAHRRGKGCKHSLACFILERAARTQRKGCD